MTPDVSVIIAAYNVEAYIERAIQSALDQEDVAVEIIVVNDASTDNTRAVVSRLNEARLRVIDLDVNSGPSIARNKGIEAAQAPWIAILDGDDAFLPGRLMRCLIRARALDADIVVDNMNAYHEADGTTRPMFDTYGFSRHSILDLATFIGNNVSFLGSGEAYGYLKPLFKTGFLREHGLRYDPDIRIGEDYMLMCEALASGARCAVESAPGYLYTRRAGSISHRLTLDDIERIAAGDRKFLMKYKLDPAARLSQERRNYGLKEAFAFTNLVNAIKQRDAKAALKAVAECPMAARHLWRAVWVRVKRLFSRSRAER